MLEQIKNGRKSPLLGKHPIPWNKGKESPQTSGEKNAMWKGNKAGYSAIHKWVEKNLKREKICVFCGETERKKLNWANITNTYKRISKDWLILCFKCHYHFDRSRLKQGIIKPCKILPKYENRTNNPGSCR